MMRLTIALFIIVFAGFGRAEAQNTSCEIGSGGLITLQGDTTAIESSILNACRNIPVQGAKYTMKAFGFCEGTPDESRGFSNCFTLIDDPVDIEFVAGSTQSFSAKLPPVGSYSHYFSIIEKEYELAVVFQLANDPSTVQGSGFVTTPHEVDDLNDCPTNPCGAPFTPVDPVNEVYNFPGNAGLPATDPGFVPYARLAVNSLTFTPQTGADKILSATFGGIRAQLLDVNLEPFLWNPSDDEVKYLMSSFELDDPFVVNGNETRANVDFDLSTAAAFVFFFNDPTGAQNDPFVRHWATAGIYLSQKGLTPTIETSTD